MNVLNEFGLIERIDIAGKKAILPDQDAHFITGIIKILVFEIPSAPYANHVHVGLLTFPYVPVVIFPGRTLNKGIGGNPVAAFAENRNAVDDTRFF